MKAGGQKPVGTDGDNLVLELSWKGGRGAEILTVIVEGEKHSFTTKVLGTWLTDAWLKGGSRGFPFFFFTRIVDTGGEGVFSRDKVLID